MPCDRRCDDAFCSANGQSVADDAFRLAYGICMNVSSRVLNVVIIRTDYE